MGDEQTTILTEIRTMLKEISDKQDRLLNDIRELKEEQKKLHNEIKLSNFVLNNIAIRSEILN